MRYQMVAAGQRHELRSADTGRKQTSLVERNDPVLLTVEHDGWGDDVGEERRTSTDANWSMKRAAFSGDAVIR